MRRVNLLHAHGSPTGYGYVHMKCRCQLCSAVRRSYALHYERRPSSKVAKQEYEARPAVRARRRLMEANNPRLLLCNAVRDAWVESSGGCLVCGYSTSSGIHPHHQDPSRKTGNPGAFRKDGRPLAYAVELAKCACMCATHHMVFHAAVPKRTKSSHEEIRGIVEAAEAVLR